MTYYSTINREAAICSRGESHQDSQWVKRHKKKRLKIKAFVCLIFQEEKIVS